MAKPALKVIKTTTSSVVSEERIVREFDYEPHSLQSLCRMSGFDLGFVRWIILQYSRKGDVVLDPFAGGGAFVFEALLSGRVAYAVDVDPLAAWVLAARMEPADLVEVTLRLQRMNLNAPVDLTRYSDVFKPFYHPQTYRELVNLKHELSLRGDRISRFISVLAMDLLYGSSESYFSVDTCRDESLLPDKQVELNSQYGEVPPYRSIVPRLIKHCAHVVRDGDVNIIRKRSRAAFTGVGSAYNLDVFSNVNVDLIITEPPLPTSIQKPRLDWLRRWFIGLDEAVPNWALSEELFSVSSWVEFMNVSLLEMAHVVNKGKVAVILLPAVKIGLDYLVDKVTDDVKSNLNRFWVVDKIYNYFKRSVILNDHAVVSTKDSQYSNLFALVLRRI